MAQVTVEQKIDSIAIFIGQQAHLTVDVTAQEGAKVMFPTFKPSQYMVPGVEVIEAGQADTSSLADGMMKVSKTFTLTSFDPHVYAIPGMKVRVNGKDYTANNQALKVVMMEVDTLHPNQFFPPKDVQDNPFQWTEWRPVFSWSVVMLLLIVAVIYLFIRLRQNKPIITRIRFVKRVLPHQRALKSIDRIKMEHMQTSEDQKTYYTQLTDTLRQYIYERFGFNAMEMTSSEIIARLQQEGDSKMISELRDLFQTADLVKFAKYSTLINENDLNLVNAVNFIDQTKQEDQPEMEKVVPKLTEGEVKTQRNRILIKSLICGFVIIVVVLLGYILYNVYQLLG